MTEHVGDPCDELPDHVALIFWSQIMVDRAKSPEQARLIRHGMNTHFGKLPGCVSLHDDPHDTLETFNDGRYIHFVSATVDRVKFFKRDMMYDRGAR